MLRFSKCINLKRQNVTCGSLESLLAPSFIVAIMGLNLKFCEETNITGLSMWLEAKLDLRIALFHVTPRNLVKRYRYFRGAWFRHM
jgi:hypothetical protein